MSLVYSSFVNFSAYEKTEAYSIDFHFQLQLQRNEVIALMNLLNRLSESVKLVHEMGSALEMMKGQIAPPIAPSSLWKRMQSLLFRS